MVSLYQSAGIISAAVMLSMSSFMCLSQVIKYAKNLRYPRAQKLAMGILLMPVLIGWTKWVNLVTLNYIEQTEFVLTIFKCISLTCFYFFIISLMGWCDEGHRIAFSKENFEVTKGQMQNLTLRFIWRKFHIKNQEDANYFLKRCKFMILQFPVFITLLVVLSIIFYTTEVGFKAGYIAADSSWLWVQLFKGLSSIVGIIGLVQYSFMLSKTSNLKKLSVKSKFVIMKLSIIFTELQPNVINVFAMAGVIADKNEYSTEEITTYTNSMLLCSEMIVVSFLQYQIYPLNEYFNASLLDS